MDDLTRRMAALRDALTPTWDDAHSDQLLAGISRLQKRRRFGLVVGSAFGAAACVVAAFVARQNLGAIERAGAWVVRIGEVASGELTKPPMREPPQLQAARTLQLTAAEAPPAKPAPTLVTPVHGYRSVRLADGSSALVSSTSGSWGAGPAGLSEADDGAQSPVLPRPAAGELRPSLPRSARDRTGAREPAALMRAADAALLSNHLEAAVHHLRRVLRDHAASPVAPLAGFTLGRVLLESLGQPSEAAEAFALARDLAPQGSLAQDALAREVEALSKAGHSRDAYERAQLYAQAYPAGRRLRAVRLFGGLE